MKQNTNQIDGPGDECSTTEYDHLIMLSLLEHETP